MIDKKSIVKGGNKKMKKVYEGAYSPEEQKVDYGYLSLKEKKCAYCGKSFCRIDYTNYAYKRLVKGHMKLYCSYTCMQKAKKETE